MSFVLAILLTLWVVQAWLVVMQVRKFSRMFLYPRRAAFDAYRPKAVVIVPFKGAEDDLPANLRALAMQDYPDYRLLLVVDSASDPAHAILQREAANYPHRRIDIVIAGQTADTQSQKIHNQLYAIDQLEAGDIVWVFADSDAAPGDNWLADMVGPLSQDITGMTTGYRWLVPMAGQRANDASGGRGSCGCASMFASAINAAVACAYRQRGLSQAWGGSMALRADTARQGDLKSYLRGALTDDYQFTRMCRALGRRVYFVPRAMSPTPVDFTWPSFFNFAYRQYLITRIYAPLLYMAAVAITSLYVLGFLAAWGVVIGAIVRQTFDWLAIMAVAAMVLTFVADQFRVRYRRAVIERAFGPRVVEQIKPALRLERWGTPSYVMLHWLIILRAGIGRTMTWRTMRYRIDGRQKVRRLRD